MNLLCKLFGCTWGKDMPHRPEGNPDHEWILRKCKRCGELDARLVELMVNKRNEEAMQKPMCPSAWYVEEKEVSAETSS